MKKQLLIAITLMLQLSTYAQLDSFDLKMYQIPRIKRHQLDFNLGASSQSSKDYTISYQNRNSSSGDFSLKHRYYYNALHWQTDITTQLGFAQFMSNLWKPNYSTKGDNTYLNIESFGMIKRFITKKLFLGIDYDINSDFSYSSYTNRVNKNGVSYNMYDEEWDNFSIKTSISPQIGYGRIEQVQDANLAVYILQDLKKENKLNRDPSQNEILAFSALISSLKNKRLFDTRTKHLYQLIELDSFLRVNNLINASDMKSSAIITDNWDYSYNPIRNSGWAIKAGFQVDLRSNESSSRYLVDSLNIQNNYRYNDYTSLLIFCNFSIHDPINLHWQQSATITPYIGFLTQMDSVNNVYTNNVTKSDSVTEFIYGESNKRDYGLKLEYNLSYYPNSRTSVLWKTTFDVWRDFNYEKNLDGSSKDPVMSNNDWNLYLTSSLIADYFISSRIRLNVSLSSYYVNYEKSQYIPLAGINNFTPYTYYSNSKSLNFYSRVRLVYNIF